MIAQATPEMKHNEKKKSHELSSPHPGVLLTVDIAKQVC